MRSQPDAKIEVEMLRMSICRLAGVVVLVAGLVSAGVASAQAPVSPAHPAVPEQTPSAPPAPKEQASPPKDAAQGASPSPAPTPPAPTPPAPTPAPASPATIPQTPAVPAPAPYKDAPALPQAPPQVPAPAPGMNGLAPPGRPQTQEFEPNASPTTPRTTTTETVEVPARPVVVVKGEASFDDAFRAIKAALDKAKSALAKAGLAQTGHALAIVTDTDEKGLKFEAAVPIAAKPAGKDDLGDGARIGESPAGRALKFRHRGPYDDIDRTYATITSYLDNKGLEASSPFIEEYPDDLKSDDDPKLAVDIYIFIKK